MSRYEKSRVRKTNGSVKYSSNYYSTIPVSDGDIFVITQTGDRLDLLAYQFYGDSQLWWYIAKANNLTTMNVEAGIQLRIPANANYATVY